MRADVRFVLVLVLVLVLDRAARGQPPSVPAADEKSRLAAVEKEIASGKDTFANRAEAARLCGDLADKAKVDSKGERLEVAVKGVAHARAAISKEKDRVEGHYYLAICIGRKLENETLPSRSEVKDIEAAGKQAVRCDERFDCAGPHRLLGSLYAEAPEWPLSIGDTDKAIQHFERSFAVAPDCPENHLLFARELKNKLDDKRRAKAEALKALNLAKKAEKAAKPDERHAAFEREARRLLEELKKD